MGPDLPKHWWRRTSVVVTALALVATGCTGSTSTVTEPRDETTEPLPAVEVPSPDPTATPADPEATPTTVPSPQPTVAELPTSLPAATPEQHELADPVPVDLVGPEEWRYQVATDGHPSAVAVIANEDGTDAEVAVAGDQIVTLYAGAGQPGVVSKVIDYDGQGLGPFVTALIAFQKDFYATLGDTTDIDALFPPLHRWNRDTSTWDVVDVSVTRPATFGFAAATPPSPPFAGASAILDLTVHDDILWATGWATLDGEVVAAVWNSRDGVNWSLERIPHQSPPNAEYGRQIAVNDAGVAVTLGGWTYAGAGTVLRPTGDSWTLLPLFDGDQADGAKSISTGADQRFFVGQAGFDSPGTVFWLANDEVVSAGDQETWQRADVPTTGPVAVSLDTFRRWSAAHVDGPVLWSHIDDPGNEHRTSTATQFVIDKEAFGSVTVPGSYVTTTHDGWIVTHTLSEFIVMDAR